MDIQLVFPDLRFLVCLWITSSSSKVEDDEKQKKKIDQVFNKAKAVAKEAEIHLQKAVIDRFSDDPQRQMKLTTGTKLANLGRSARDSFPSVESKMLRCVTPLREMIDSLKPLVEDILSRFSLDFHLHHPTDSGPAAGDYDWNLFRLNLEKAIKALKNKAKVAEPLCETLIRVLNSLDWLHTLTTTTKTKCWKENMMADDRQFVGIVVLISCFIKNTRMMKEDVHKILVDIGIKDVVQEAGHLKSRDARAGRTHYAILLANIWSVQAEIFIKGGDTSTILATLSKDKHLQALHAGCRFLKHQEKESSLILKVIEKVPNQVKSLYKSSPDTKVVANGVTSVCNTFPLAENLKGGGVKDMDIQLFELLEKVQHLKAKLIGFFRIPLFNVPKVPGLCFIEFLVQNARDLLISNHDSIAYATHYIEAFRTELDFIVSTFPDVFKQGIEKQKHDGLLTQLVDVAYQVATTTVEEAMVGLEDQKIEIIDRLTRGRQQRDIVSIVGMPRIGKTTLGNNVFCNQTVVHHFRIHAWICVSQKYKKRDLLLDILRYTIPITDNINAMSDDDLQLLLYKQLKGKRYLIVMDGMWSATAWDDLRISFPDDSNSSRILITSRLRDMVSKISDPHLLRPLSEKESWELLKLKIFQENECPQELLEVGWQIAKNCKGLPLAIGAIAGLLNRTGGRSQDVESNCQ
ncbi:OLC1v1009902C1 [Oldenlandia corymbosa var. corymbosa]|uniref:OLC1v1009902C1 n=1 Tax=Oldenlandia corymbosa var. corymbosa TaxID=529605 RepID=A0AAV1DPZ4_OLDCO|nr:OLC1v1009902C1 [Oldenlandia corymbosa var. corymbosa]